MHDTTPSSAKTPGRIAGKVAIVSGAASGIGAAQARLLAQEGARVVLGDVANDAGIALANDLGDAAMFVHLDVTQPAQWSAAVAAAQARFGIVDVLVNNAGVGADAEFDDETEESFAGSSRSTCSACSTA